MEMEGKEKRIRAITKLYYSNPRVQEAIAKFSIDREVVPRYYDGFGKRPDIIQYSSDVMGLVNKGATSFHCSEELWKDPLEINSDMGVEEFNDIRKGWDLVIDIDSPFLDCSKIATLLIIEALEQHGVKNYGIKFSGSKGFHVIVGRKAFPKKHDEKETKEMFPEWPRAISEFLMDYIRREYNKKVGEELSEKDVEKRTNLTKEELRGRCCLICNKSARKGSIVKFRCDTCSSEIERRDIKITKRRLKCLNNYCAGILEIVEEKDHYYCETCKDPDNKNLPLSSIRHSDSFEETRGINAEKIAALDLVLVAPRHLFRMPYSLHEKTALSSIVLEKNEIDKFSPRDADPLKVKIKEFLPEIKEGEAKILLSAAIDWKKTQSSAEDKLEKKKYKNYEKIDVSGVSEDMFPAPIKKLMKGLEEGRKRGLFILLTFLRSLNFPAEEINNKIREWNKKNKPPLKEGYVKSQIDWHLRQKRRILPPNYENDSFYRDLKLFDKMPDVKNPLVEVLRKIKYMK